MSAVHRAGGAVAIVPARGGSKRIPDKNLVRLGGRPLIAHTIAAARAARTISRVVVSTDSARIAAAARAAGAEVIMRPARLATDVATTESVIRHALSELDCPADVIVVLQPTSPLRTARDIDAAVRLLRSTGAPSVVGVCAVEHPVEWIFRLTPRRRLRPIARTTASRRRTATRAVRLNGAIYAVRRDIFERTGRLRHPTTVAYEMPHSRSIDIDEPRDLDVARALLERG